jgi:hypothetical protein
MRRIRRRLLATVEAFLLARVAFEHTEAVSAQEIDQYLEALEEPKRGTLTLLRRRILDVLPDAEQGISYGSRPSGSAERRSPGSPRSRTI